MKKIIAGIIVLSSLCVAFAKPHFALDRPQDGDFYNPASIYFFKGQSSAMVHFSTNVLSAGLENFPCEIDDYINVLLASKYVALSFGSNLKTEESDKENKYNVSNVVSYSFSGAIGKDNWSVGIKFKGENILENKGVDVDDKKLSSFLVSLSELQANSDKTKFSLSLGAMYNDNQFNFSFMFDDFEVSGTTLQNLFSDKNYDEFFYSILSTLGFGYNIQSPEYIGRGRLQPVVVSFSSYIHNIFTLIPALESDDVAKLDLSLKLSIPFVKSYSYFTNFITSIVFDDSDYSNSVFCFEFGFKLNKFTVNFDFLNTYEEMSKSTAPSATMRVSYGY